MAMFQDFIAKISSGLFCSKKYTDKITPQMYKNDEELINVNTLTIHNIEDGFPMDCEFKSGIQNPDLELGFGPIVEISPNHIIVDMKAFEKSKIYENYKILIDTIVYLTTPFKYGSSVFLSDFSISSNKLLLINEFQVVMPIEIESKELRSNKKLV